MQKATERQEGDVNAVTFIQGGRVDHGRRPWSLPRPEPSLGRVDKPIDARFAN